MYATLTRTALAAVFATGLLIAPAYAQDGAGESNDRPAAESKEGKPDRGERKGKHGPHGDRGPRGHGHRFIRALFKDIDLTEDQRVEVREIMEAGRDEMEAWRDEHRDQIKALREQMREAHQAGDDEKAAEVREQLRTLFESRPKPEDRADEIREVLTPEQTEQFDQNIEAIKQKMQERRDEMKERGPRGDGDWGKGKKDKKGKKGPGKGDKGPDRDSDNEEQLEM